MKLPKFVSFDASHCYFLIVVFVILQRPMSQMLKKSRFSNKLRLEFAGPCVRQRELTYPALGSTMAFGARHLQLVLATDLLPKDNGHTES
jgi:hypothetical protein